MAFLFWFIAKKYRGRRSGAPTFVDISLHCVGDGVLDVPASVFYSFQQTSIKKADH